MAARQHVLGSSAGMCDGPWVSRVFGPKEELKDTLQLYGILDSSSGMSISCKLLTAVWGAKMP